MPISHKRAAALSAVAIGLSSSAAMAQASLQELFDMAQEEGAVISTSDVVTQGGETEWRDFVMTGPTGDIEVSFPWVRETDLGGGASQIMFAPEGELAFFDGDTEMARVGVTNDNLVYTIEATNAGLRHTYSADSLNFVRISGEILTDLDLSLGNMAGFHSFLMDENIATSGALSATNMAVKYEFVVPGADSLTDYVIDGLELSYSFDGPVVDPDTLESFAPYSGALSMKTGATKGSGAFGQGAERVELSFTGQGSSAEGTLGNGRIDYTSSAGSLEYLVSMAGMGFPPFELSASDMRVNFGAPIVASDQTDDAKIEMAFTDLVLGEGLWAMFDPQVTLPRDPMNIILDIGARMRWLVEPPMAEDVDQPIEVEQVDIKDITIQAAGAEILANGAAALDFSGPIPTGDGMINVTIMGVIGLTEKLANLGLMQPEMVMGARGMMGAFAKPVGDDHYESEIVLSPNGTITANGIPLPIQ